MQVSLLTPPKPMSLSAIGPAASYSAAASARGPALLNGNRFPESGATKEQPDAQAGTTSTPATTKTGSEDTKALPADVSNAAKTARAETTGTDKTDSTSPKTSNSTTTLSPEALAQLAKLKARDLEVRQHEAAHLAVAGGLATSGPTYSYQKGPDGVNYAVAGEVGIDTSPGRTPEETIERAQRVQAAALAPAEPSGPDLAVAAQAQQLEAQARSELALQRAAQLNQTYTDGKRSNSGSLSVFA